ncbi:MAG: ABC transporter permease subunit [Eubacteriales bacterium]|nr:ABC transporter permease subunit [Eubacteriales bacterium]
MGTKQKKFTRTAIVKDWRKNKKRYLLLLPLILYFIVFSYLPMGGIVMAFCDYKPKLGIFGSLVNRFVGFQNFTDFFQSFYFGRLLKNTIILNGLNLLISFPLTILVALLINEVGNKLFKKTVQTISYLPYFISMVVVCGIVVDFCKSTGLLGTLMTAITGKTQNLLGVAGYWRTIYIGSGLWQGLGFGTILYIAALSGVDQTLYEAAQIDGAGYLKQMWHVTLPGIRPTIVITLILQVGMLMASSYEKTILMYNSQIYETADIIASYVYRKGLLDGDYSFSTAVGLFNSVINLALLTITNKISKKYTETSLF